MTALLQGFVATCRSDGARVIALLMAAGLGWGALSCWSRSTEVLSVCWLLSVLGVEWAILLMLLGNSSLRAALRPRGIWVVAIAFRVFGLVAIPVLEDDHYRFLWDGYVFAQTGNPYAMAPAGWFHDPEVPERFQQVLDQVNYPDVPTIYGPLTELGFLLAYLTAPAALWPWKLLLMAADLALLFMLPRLAPGGCSVRAMAFVALCPLSIHETAFNAHPDALAVSLLAGAMLSRASHRDGWLGVCCGAAVGAKIVAILLVPFLLWQRRGTAWLAFVLALLALYLPFWLQGSSADLAGLRAFAQDWEFNSSMYALLAWCLDPVQARLASIALFGTVWLGSFYRWSRLPVTRVAPPPGLLVLAAFFLLSPTFNPWYALWLLPFVALQPAPTGIALLAAVSLSYLTEANLGGAGLHGFSHPLWVRPVEFGLIGLAFAAEMVNRWRARLKLPTGTAP